MRTSNTTTIGLALSGAGNRSSFYVGFLEVLDEAGIPVDFIAAMSGASLVAAAYACGTLPQFKERILTISSEDIKKLTAKSSGGGFYSLDRVEMELRTLYTKGLSFEEARPHMAFVTADIESGELVDLCMGDIAKAACASCTLPGVFEPVQWGHRVLVDGGILSQVPLESLNKFSPDITIGVNMRGTKYIFSRNLITLKRILNFFKKVLFIGELEQVFDHLLESWNEEKGPKQDGLFAVLGKSLDVVIKEMKKQEQQPQTYDLLITPDLPKKKRSDFSPQLSEFCYGEGRKCAQQNLDKIKKLVEQKSKVLA